MKKINIKNNNYSRKNFKTQTFFGCSYRPDMNDTDIGLIGFASNTVNINKNKQYSSINILRDCSTSYKYHHLEPNINPFNIVRVNDMGNVLIKNLTDLKLKAKNHTDFFKKVNSKGIIPVTIGGDHKITLPILRGIAGKNSRYQSPIAMIHFDAHPDTYRKKTDNNNYTGGIFRTAAEEGLIDPKHTIQLGLRGIAKHPLRDVWSLNNFTVLYYHEIIEKGIEWTIKKVRHVVDKKPVYLTFDIDALDTAYAPAVFNPEPEGLTSREFFGILRGLRGIDLAGADVANYYLPFDGPGLPTAHIICNFLFQIIAHIADYKINSIPNSFKIIRRIYSQSF